MQKSALEFVPIDHRAFYSINTEKHITNLLTKIYCYKPEILRSESIDIVEMKKNSILVLQISDYVIDQLVIPFLSCTTVITGVAHYIVEALSSLSSKVKGEKIDTLLGSKPSVTLKKAKSALSKMESSSEKLIRELGFTPGKVEDAIEKSVKYFQGETFEP